MNYKKISYFENRHRIKKLKKFKSLAIKYFKNTQKSFYNRECVENSIAQKTRSQINSISPHVNLIIRSSGIPTSIIYTPPPMIGGSQQEIDLFDNIFLLHQYDINKEQIFDIIEKSIGVYEYDKILSIIRTINPFFWINRILSYIANIPFEIFKSFGFEINSERPLFKILGFIFYLITVIASLIAILQAFEVF
ncbi:TPA: hypothetical protein DEP90_02560 [Patescibacteria group bacterium]|nr:hypothetical protein [Patescibacteria group bacterium]